MTDKGRRSRISLLVEGYPRRGFQVLSRFLEGGGHGLCITRLHPDYVVQKHDLRNVECHWLSGCKRKRVLSPKSLGNLVKAIRQGIREKDGSLVFLDGLEYLLMWNDMGKVMAALREIEAAVEGANARMFICIDPLTIEQKDVEKLWEAFPRFNAGDVLEAFSSSQPQQIFEVLQASADQTAEGLLQSRELHATP